MAAELSSYLAIAGWVIRLAALVIVPMQRAPAAARAWLLLVLFEPILGTLLFLLIGSPRFPAWRTRRFAAMQPFRHSFDEGFRAAQAPADETSAFAMALGAYPPAAGNQLDLYPDYEEVVVHLVADIDAAVHSVDILVYIFANDRIGQRVAAALGRATTRGVRCRVLIDPVGSARWRGGASALIRGSGAIYRQALPLRWLKGRTRRDLRNHRKLWIIDGSIGWIGSQNIVAPDFRPGVVNRELVIRAHGPLVGQMQLQFEMDWHMEAGDTAPEQPAMPPPAGSAIAQLLPSGPDYPVEGFQALLVWQLHRAVQRVVIVTPYFIPDADLVSAMRSAVLRGVDVHLLVSQVVDQPIVALAQQSFYAELMAAGVNIHRFRRYLLHAKNVLIDEHLAIVGSSNVDLRSFQLNAEISLLVRDLPSVGRVSAIQKAWLAESDLLDRQAWAARPLHQKLLQNLARMLDSLV